jgi:hypothetical protein
MLTILHAAWPAGLVFGTLPIILTDSLFEVSWAIHSLWMLLPVVAYGLMYGPCKFPVDERIKAGVPYMDMLKLVGFLSASLAGFMIIYEIGNQVDALTAWKKPETWFYVSLGLGVATGAGMAGFTKSLAQEIGSRNITVNCVAPGFIDTDMTHALGEEQRAKLVEHVPLKRLGQPADIANAVAFLAGPGASYITGVTLHVNGGMYME